MQIISKQILEAPVPDGAKIFYLRIQETELLVTDDYTDITITDIAKELGVGRKTAYTHVRNLREAGFWEDEKVYCDQAGEKLLCYRLTYPGNEQTGEYRTGKTLNDLLAQVWTK